ncbi:hypothetical protein EJB05_08621, partial [Eragrostis curvula]
MATTVTICSPAVPALQSPPELDVRHHRRQYLPSVWGDFFLSHQPCTESELVSMKEKAQDKKEEVRRILLDAAASEDLARKLDLIDTLQRLGVGYHYRKEIDDVLRAVYDEKHGGSDDLYVTSLRFYLLRKHGYAVPSDVFLKFRDEHGNISSDDVYSLMMLYDAAHLRTRGEDILDSIIALNKCRLKNVVQTSLDKGLLEEVRLTLETPRFRRVERVEARRFILVYEKKAARDETILEFAKLDYNIVQALCCKELKELTVWWKDFMSRTDVGFARDRLVEMYFWMMAIVYEPYFTYSRIMLTKMAIFVALLDDLYDNYATTEESEIFTAAIQRLVNLTDLIKWDEKATEELPANLREFYKNILGDTNEIVEELKLQNNKNAEMVIKLLKWRDEQYVPTNVTEHLQISVESIAAMHTANLAFISLGDVTTREAVEWAFTYPRIIRAVSILARISNDIMTHEREQASEHMASRVQTCMKQYGITEEEAIEKLKGIIETSWMDIVQECLDREHSIVLYEKVVSFAQSIDFVYKREDAYTLSSNLQDTLTSLYVKFV